MIRNVYSSFPFFLKKLSNKLPIAAPQIILIAGDAVIGQVPPEHPM